MELIRRATWREAVTYRDTWPHEYVMVKKDRQEELLAAFCARIAQGEGVECRFFHQKRTYLFLGDHKYWTMTDCPEIDLDTDDYVLNRALLYHDRRDFVIKRGDTSNRKEQLQVAKPKEGVDYVDVHNMWQDEALDFTPWLAANIGLLSDALGLKLEHPKQEEPVGPFRCDILASEVGSGINVAIENQLETTDHSHLGQLLTYAAGLEAEIAVWVAPNFLYEHAMALRRLNTWTSSGLRVYGVRVMVSKTGAALEPRLCSVVGPADYWNERLILAQGAMDPRKLQFDAFFRPLVAELLTADFAAKAINHFNYTGRRFPSERNPGIWYAASLEGNIDAWVTLHISTADQALTKQVFKELMQNQGDIEASIDLGPAQEWHWRPHPNFLFSSINIRRDGCIDDPQEKQKETGTWMLDMLPRFKEVFESRVENILTRLQGKDAS